MLTGDFVVVVNAEKVKLTGRKMEQLEYDRYTYHPGGRRVDSIAKVMANHPERIIKLAVRLHAAQEQARRPHVQAAQGV